MKIIVSLTTWKPRLITLIKTLDCIINQIVMPDSIELNLSEEEFPNKELDFPIETQEYLKNHKDLINCNWIYKNTRTFKKIIPTLIKYKDRPEYLLLSIDDDVIYRNDYIKIMVDYLNQYNADSFCLANAKVIGNRQIYKSSCFDKDFYEKLNDNIIEYGIDDSYIEYYLKCKGKIIANFRPNNVRDITQFHDEILPLHDEYLKDQHIQKAKNEIQKIKF